MSKCQQKDEVQLFVYMSVKDDGISLFGFYDKAEKEMFLKLITVSGIGPKLASSVLSGISSTKLALAIASSDHATLNKIKGVGKKTAERIILELKDKITIGDNMVSNFDIDNISNMGDNVNDAIIALMSLGLTKEEAVKAVNKVQDKTQSAEAILTEALKRG